MSEEDIQADGGADAGASEGSGAQDRAATSAADAAGTEVQNKAGADGAETAAVEGGQQQDGANEADIQYDLKAPEGFETLDEEGMKAFLPLIQKNKLPAEDAQEGINIVGALLQRQMERMRAQITEQNVKRAEQWLAEVKADPDLGGDKLVVNSKRVEGLLSKYARTDEAIVYEPGHAKAGQVVPGGTVKQALQQAGLGNHPDLFRFFNRIALAMGEDGFIEGDGNAPKKEAMSELDFMKSVFKNAE